MEFFYSKHEVVTYRAQIGTLVYALQYKWGLKPGKVMDLQLLRFNF